jgi:aminoglycoside phosphotransferase (APT) family kinase protein
VNGESPRGHNLPGLDTDRVVTWFARHVGDDCGLTFSLVANGRSNLTYAATDEAGRRWILRRPPVGAVHASAHDVGREHRIMAALYDTGVPVPRMVGYCADDHVTGAPFYVMEFVDGVVMDEDAAIETLDGPARERFLQELGSTLARIHSVDLAVVGLGDLVKPYPLVRRQLRRWSTQLQGRTDPTGMLLRELHDRLEADAPDQDEPVLVHGDYRPGNVIVAPDGSIAAVLDWELTAAGDGLADLGWLAAWWSEGLEWTPAPHLASPSLPRLLDAYAAAGGPDIERLPYYQAFAYWRLACIGLGVYERYASGAMGEQTQALDELLHKPERFAQMARSLLQ